MPRLLAALAVGTCLGLLPAAGLAEPVPAIAMHGTPKFAPGFAQLPYADPAAKPGGEIVLGQTGSFDTLNPLIIKGEPAAGLREWLYEPLMMRSLDEPFTLYGLIAETIDVPADRSSATFAINPLAKFSDGHAITADDLIFSMEVLREKGRPNHRTYYKKVKLAEKLDERTVRFVFDTANDREMPLIMGSMPVLPKHKLTAEAFDKTTLEPPVGSGPYTIAKVDAGRSITYKRNPSYWGRDLAVNRHRFNIDTIRFEYFRDSSVLFEAFKSGLIDQRLEDDPQRWADGYNVPAVREGRIIKRELETGLPAGMSGLVFNTRRDVFKDQRVRQALIRLFNFEWANKTLYHGLFKRTQSFFERSYLSAFGRPADATELEFLADYKAVVRGEVLDGKSAMPVSDGSGHNRDNAREAFKLLKDAGYAVQDGVLVDAKTKAPLSFEILAPSGGQERLVQGYASDLARLGIKATLRLVDSAQFQSRLKSYDYDMVSREWVSSLSPGNEQLFRWSSQVADQDGSYNYAGVKSPAVDAMIGKLLAAESPDAFAAAVRSLDRVLMSGDYVIPLFHLPKHWVAHWHHIRAPEKMPLWGYNIDTWWIDGAK